VLVPRSGVLPSPVRRTLLYRQVTGHLPPLLQPRTFTEKLNWRITLDRRELLAPTCDKLAMKEHARRLAPGLVRVPETLWDGTDVGELVDVDLPDHWVLKPNHSCIRRLFGRGPADVADLRRGTAGWAEERYWRKSEEWAYRRARPCLLVEEFIGAPGVVPADLKVMVVDGEPRLVELHTGRDDDHGTRLYSPEWEPLPWTIGYPPGPDADPPERLEDLLKAATALADGFDMLRVDCYEADGELWFGELTPYPGAGLSPLEPDLDAWLGAAWTLPPLRRTRG
jgi:teichuronopeptide biosynthesis TupA-like protein